MSLREPLSDIAEVGNLFLFVSNLSFELLELFLNPVWAQID